MSWDMESSNAAWDILRNSKTFEDAIERLLEWASASKYRGHPIWSEIDSTDFSSDIPVVSGWYERAFSRMDEVPTNTFLTIAIGDVPQNYTATLLGTKDRAAFLATIEKEGLGDNAEDLIDWDSYTELFCPYLNELPNEIWQRCPGPEESDGPEFDFPQDLSYAFLVGALTKETLKSKTSSFYSKFQSNIQTPVFSGFNEGLVLIGYISKTGWCDVGDNRGLHEI